MAGIRETFTIGTHGDTTDVDAGKLRKKPKITGEAKIPKDKGRKKRRVKITFNSPKTSKVTYG